MNLQRPNDELASGSWLTAAETRRRIQEIRSEIAAFSQQLNHARQQLHGVWLLIQRIGEVDRQTFQ